MNTVEKDRLSPELSARIAALSPEKRALLECELGATAPMSLPIRDLFESPIVSDLARVVELAQAGGEHAYPLSIPCMAHGAATSPGANSTS